MAIGKAACLKTAQTARQQICVITFRVLFVWCVFLEKDEDCQNGYKDKI